MNNIYKVIWSKAKNCYVVASEIARSHTKSASGSEKIGGVARHALLALGAACAIACGGFVNVGAYTAVDVSTPSAGVAKVYDADTVDSMLKEKADKSNTFTKEQTYTQAQVKKLINDLKIGDVATNKDNITTNKDNITTLVGKTVGLSTDGKSLNGMNSVETGALTVKGKISNDAGVTTTLEVIDASMKQTVRNKEDIATLQGTTNGQQTAIDDLKKKTKDISWEAGAGTSISGVTIKDGNIVGNGNSAITQLANVETDKIKTDSINGKSLTGTTVATEKEVKDVADAVKKETDARTEADKALDEKITKNSQNIAMLNENGVKYDTDVKDKITLAGLDGTKITRLKDAALNDSSTDAVTGRQLNKTNEDLAAEVTARTNKDTELEEKITKNSGDITTIKQRTAGIDRIDATKETTIEGHVTVDNLGNVKAKGNVTADGKLTGKGVDAGDGAITTTGAVNAGSLTVENASNLKGDVTMDKKLSVTGDTSLKKTDVDGALNVTGESSLKNTKVEGMLTTTGKATFQEAVEMDKGLTVTSGDTTLKGKLTVTGEADLKNTEVGGTLGVTGATTLSGELTAKENATFEKDVTVKGTTNLKNTTVAGDLKVTGTITTDTMVFGVKPTNYTEIDQGKVTSKNSYINGAGQSITSSSTFDVEKNEVGFVNNATGEQSYHKQTAKGINGSVTDKAGNTTYTKVTATENSFQVQDKDGKNKNHQVNTKDSSVTEITNENGNTTKTEQTAKDITNTAKDGTITNDAQNIVNKATTMDTNVTGKATESYGELDTTVNGKETHNVTGTKTENVTGKVTENYNGGQETNVTGNQDIHVTKNQTNKIDGDQVNIIGGSQTTTATDINRNASSGMIDTVENASGSNKETKVAGQTTTDVKLASGEEGHYIRGATESRDYLLNGTLKNSETKTAEATSSEVTDGTNKASTIQDAKNLAGSVTNGTETGISGIHANNDGSVSIDSTVVGGGMSSVINQKKDSIQSAVGDGTNSTVIRQDKDNVTIASFKGMVAIGGKDIVNNAQDTITNTAGTSITNQVKDSKVTTDVDGTTFENKTAAVSDGGTTTTKINGNLINTGRVDANELGVSDKDDQGNTADFSVKAGEGIKGSATDKDGNKTYTKVTATENSFQVQDKDGNIKNHQVNTKDKSENTITNGTKANTVTSTADGTTFNNSTANTVFEGGTYTDTTIKGNTITTGKVTMDYADVMKDLGVYGNARVDKDMTVKGNTTLGEAGKDTKLTVNSKATFNENATFEKGAEVKNGLTVSSGGLNVTGESTFNDKVTMNNGLDVTGGVASDSFTVKGTDIKIDSSGINAGGTVISNVADGSISEGSKDAVNGGQLYQVKNDLEGKVNKVGANAAAMANLHPMEFDPDSKWNIAAAMGNYGSETATAIGAFYRPNEDVMVNFSTAFGTGENMVGGGVSVRLGKGSNKLSREESNALKAQVNDLTARMDALLSVLNPNMSKDFPDVPENHWAYEAVSRLAGNDIVQGYPDGEFHGDRTMTRYEMAEIIYNALSRGAEAERELVEEFKPELQAMAASEKATAERAEG